MTNLLKEFLTAQAKLERALAIVEAVQETAVAFIDLNNPGTIWVGVEDDVDYFSGEGWKPYVVTSARFHQGKDRYILFYDDDKPRVCDVRIVDRSSSETRAVFEALLGHRPSTTDELQGLLND